LICPILFGPCDASIYALTEDLFLETFRQETLDPRWLHSGVFQIPPTPNRKLWLYVSSGLSNAWDDEQPDPTTPSGLGMEFVLQTPDREEWAIARLAHVVAFQILLSYGKYPGRNLLNLHDRIPLGGSIAPRPSDLTWLTVGLPDDLPVSFKLPSRSVDLLNIVGITENEARYARQNGAASLFDILRTAGGISRYRLSAEEPCGKCIANFAQDGVLSYNVTSEARPT
jgi:hypothetical protein